MHTVYPVQFFRCGHVLQAREQHPFLETDVRLQLILDEAERRSWISDTKEEPCDAPMLSDGTVYQRIFRPQHREHHFLLHGEVRQQLAVEERAAFLQHRSEVRTCLQVPPDAPTKQQPLVMFAA